jgi:hypothetical protein
MPMYERMTRFRDAIARSSRSASCSLAPAGMSSGRGSRIDFRDGDVDQLVQRAVPDRLQHPPDLGGARSVVPALEREVVSVLPGWVMTNTTGSYGERLSFSP